MCCWLDVLLPLSGVTPIVCGCVARILQIDQTPAIDWLFIGTAAPGVQPEKSGCTHKDSSSYCMASNGEVRAAGARIIPDAESLPASSFIQQPAVCHKRESQACDKVFSAVDEVVVVLDCTAHTLRLQSPNLQHGIDIQQQHYKQEWVLNVNFECGEHRVRLVPVITKAA